MLRLLFRKTGNAVWISHLDLMRLFQRAFQRAGLRLTHTQGFNPRPSVSIALPLSVGIESCCELLDFELEGDSISCDEICARLNRALIEGVEVLEVYDSGRKLRDLSLLACRIWLEYDNGIPDEAENKINALFASGEVFVEKRTKNGTKEQNIASMIRRMSCCPQGDSELVIDAVVCCQNPTLNPTQIIAAIEQYLPALRPDFARCCRVEIYDQEEKVFR